MPLDTRVEPTREMPEWRLWAGLGVGILVAPLAAVVAFGARAFFQIADEGDEPVIAAYMVALMLWMAALPFLAGLVTAGVLKALAWRIVVAVSVIIPAVLFAAWALLS